MSNDFNFCPKCKSDKIEFSKNRWFCPDCKMVLYNNVAAAVGVIIKDSENNYLFEVRMKDPKKGMLTIPGGFVNADECAEDAIIRECQEEIGLTIEKPEFIRSFPNTYEYKDFVYKTCDLFFMLKLPSKYKNLYELLPDLTAEEDEVQNFKVIKINSADDVDALPIAFDSTIKILKYTAGEKNGK
ncbi:MAG: NUDIX domain-containing protein [Treponema sp.]|nr:NUDIX domain-containing protein [Treponema sp.]